MLFCDSESPDEDLCEDENLQPLRVGQGQAGEASLCLIEQRLGAGTDWAQTTILDRLERSE
jgi:hypothetical protein